MTDPLSHNRASPARASSSPGGALLARATALQEARDFAAAEELYRRFLAVHPKDLVALNNAAIVAKALGKYDLALHRLRKAARLYPAAAKTHFNLGNTLHELKQLDEAVEAYCTAIALAPDYVKAYLNLGNVLNAQRRHAEAARSYQQALLLGGDDAETHSNLGHCFKAQAKFHEALTHFICAATLAPERSEFHLAIGATRFEIKDYPEAVISFRRVLELNPSSASAANALLYIAQLTCDWAEVARLAPTVRAATDAAIAAGVACIEGALESITRDADPARNYHIAASGRMGFAMPERLYRPKPRTAAAAPDKIRLGYLSADFRDHPVAQVMAGVFGRHDRDHFTVTAYSYGVNDNSAVRQRIATDCDRFVDLHDVPDDESARRICDDGIDILIDLTLWTQHNRPRICALHPAALQIQYLGFPGTSGTLFHDYAIVDHTIVPPEHRPFWSERLIYMPHSYFVADRDQPIAASGLNRQQCGLPENGVVFCSFNQTYKIEPIVFDAWMRILDEIPGSVLWLPRADAAAEANLRRAAEHRRIAAERLVFVARTAEKAQHLERLGLADIALDTLAYNGHTTTSDALWAGIPVVVATGRHFASRVGASLLKAVGLEELIAHDVEDYIQLALHLARTPSERTRLRAYLAAARRTQPLFDTDRSVILLEQAYRRIWTDFQAGMPPADIDL